MGDYSITEMLTRTIALERLKHLSDEHYAATQRADIGLMSAINREREELKRQFFKVVK